MRATSPARGAGAIQSTAAENVGAMFSARRYVFGIKGILFPLIVRAIQPIASIVASALCTARKTDPMHALNKGSTSSILALVGFAVAVYYMQGRWWLLGCSICGIITSFFRPLTGTTRNALSSVRSVAKASLPVGNNIISSLAVGMETLIVPVIVISFRSAELLLWVRTRRWRDLRPRRASTEQYCDHGTTFLWLTSGNGH